MLNQLVLVTLFVFGALAHYPGVQDSSNALSQNLSRDFEFPSNSHPESHQE